MKSLAHSTLLASTLLVACAAPDGPQVAGSADLSCTRQASTGTTINRVQCRTADQVEADRRAAEATTGDIRKSSSTGGGQPRP